MFSHQWYDNLAIGVCFEVVWVLETFADESMVVNFAIDSKGNALIAVGQRLSTRINTNDRQTFVGQHCMEVSIILEHTDFYIPVLLAV